MAGEVKKLETKQMQNAANQFKSITLEFSWAKGDIEKATTALLSTWVGESRNAFETQYTVLTRALKDLEENLYDFYDSLVQAEAAYIDADKEVSKAIDQARE